MGLGSFSGSSCATWESVALFSQILGMTRMVTQCVIGRPISLG